MTKRKPQPPQAVDLSVFCRQTLQGWFKESKLSQQQVAAGMEWKQQTSVSQYFNARSDLSLNQAARMCEVLGHSFQQLMALWKGESGNALAVVLADESELRLVMAYRRHHDVLRSALLVLADQTAPVANGRGAKGTGRRSSPVRKRA